jgi:hypothetical protein
MFLTDEEIEKIAQAIHAGYLRNAGAAGIATGAAAVPWEALEETYKETNRDAARKGAAILAEAGLSLVPGRQDPPALDPDDLERLARREHERWMAERIDAGWRYGTPRDNDRKLHPSLVPYDALSEAERQKDRDGVRTLVASLSLAGLAVVPDQVPIKVAISLPLAVSPGHDRVPKPRLALRIGFTGHRPQRLADALEKLNRKRQERADPPLSRDQYLDALQETLKSVFEVIERDSSVVRADPGIRALYGEDAPLLRLVTGAAAGADRMAMDIVAGLRGGKRSVSAMVETPALASPGRKAEWRIDAILPARPATFAFESSEDVEATAAMSGIDHVIMLTRYWRETFRLADTTVSLPPVWSMSAPFSPKEPEGTLAPSYRSRLRSEMIAAFGKIDDPPTLPTHAAPLSGQRLTLDHRRAADFQFRQTDLLVAVWDGEPGAGPGGTADIILRAHEAGMPVVLVDATDPSAASRLIRSIKRNDHHRKDMADWLPVSFEVETNPIAAEGTLLRNALLALLSPPPSTPGGGHVHGDQRGEGARLTEFLGEAWPREKPPQTYEVFQMVMGRFGHRIGIWREFFSPAAVPMSGGHWDNKGWTTFINGNPDEGLQGVHLKQQLFRSFAFADMLAVRYAGLYRSAFIRGYLWAALAVMVALLAFFLTPMAKWGFIHPYSEMPLKAALVALEFWIIWKIAGLVHQGRREHWHNKSVEYRALAESLRHLRFLATFGEFSEAGGMAEGPVWWTWYLRAVARNIGLPQGHLDGDYQRSLLQGVDASEVEGQIGYNRSLSARARAVEHGAHALGEKLFAVTGGVLGGWLAVFVLAALVARTGATDFAYTLPGLGELLKKGSGQAYAFLDGSKPFLGVLAALLPTVGAALAGIRFTADFDGRAARSAATAKQLEQDRERIRAACANPDFDLTRKTLVGVSETLSEDVASFLWLYGRKSLQTPG